MTDDGSCKLCALGKMTMMTRVESFIFDVCVFYIDNERKDMRGKIATQLDAVNFMT